MAVQLAVSRLRAAPAYVPQRLHPPSCGPKVPGDRQGCQPTSTDRSARGRAQWSRFGAPDSQSLRGLTALMPHEGSENIPGSETSRWTRQHPAPLVAKSPSFPRSAWECCLRRSASWPEPSGGVIDEWATVVPNVLPHTRRAGEDRFPRRAGTRGSAVASSEKSPEFARVQNLSND
jgi:hypothetical protein